MRPSEVTRRLRYDMEAIRDAALAAVDPAAAVRRHLVCRDGKVWVGGQVWEPSGDEPGRVLLLAVGKASGSMALAAVTCLREQVQSGVVVTKYGHMAGISLPPSLQVIESGHPIPDAAGVRAGQVIIEQLQATTCADQVLLLLSGGGSALLPAPVAGVTLDDLQVTTDLLLRAGATIVEINAVRKHLSQLKGGQLARLAAPAPVTTLILSDVVGDPLDAIASGPTAPDPTSYSDAVTVLQTYGLLDRVPRSVATHLQAGVAGERPETPKPGDPVFRHVTNVIVGSNHLAARAAVDEAASRGYRTLLLTTFVEGEAREVAKVAVALAKGVKQQGDPISPPACLVWGGETTVTVQGQGKGGRNQEFALASAIGLDGLSDVMLMALATDGTDGPTDAAGAVVGGMTADRARKRGWDLQTTLRDNNAYPLLDDVGALLRLGPTGTNVNDLMVLLVA